MKILVTGYKGFIAQNLINALIEDHDVCTYSINEDLPNVEGLDWCIHLGANTSSTESNVEKIIDNNYDFSRWLLNECQKHNVNFQYASAAEIYGNFKDFRETGPANPLTPYAWSKFLFDRYVDGFKDRWTIRVQGFRYFDVYSDIATPRGDNSSFYANFAKQAQATNSIKIFYGSGHYHRDFIHIDQVIDIHKKFFDIEESGLWNIGTGDSRSIESLAKEIANNFDVKIENIEMPSFLKHRYRIFSRADINKLSETLNK